MGRTSIRSTVVPAVNVEHAHDVTERVAELRLRMAAIGGTLPQHVQETPPLLPVPGVLSIVLPNGGLPRQAVTHASETPALITEIIDQVVRADSKVGVVGWPELSYAGISTPTWSTLLRYRNPAQKPLRSPAYWQKDWTWWLCAPAQHTR